MLKKTAEPDVNSNEEVERLMRQGPKGDVNGGLALLRRIILLDGLVADSDGMSQLRIYIWLILLNCAPLPTDAYLALIHRGPSPAYAKIRNDTFRTLATDPLFKRRVSEASLIRLLNALAWTLHDAQNTPQQTPLPPSPEQPSKTNPAAITIPTTTSATGSPSKHIPTPPLPTTAPPPPTTTATTTSALSIYLQGLNVLSAPFLYAARSEIQAYTLLTTLLTTHLPSYITPSLSGVHRGLALVDTCLAIIDPKLSAHLLSHQLSASIYAFPSVLTLCACTPPLPEVLYLWDFLFAYGVHLNILAIVAQLVIVREELLATERPGGFLGRGFPALQGRRVVGLAVSFVPKVGEAVWREVVEHVR
ncbi:hypothetical protein MMC30_000196 [Trapelia coarctata]|nr:hypothetical protein [Trapelia coarctata]